MAVREIPVETLTPARFAPFGALIDAPARAPDYRGPNGTRGWHIPFEGGRGLLSVLRTPPLELRIGKLERHFHVTQAFVPLGGSPAVLVVAPPGDPPGAAPRLDELRAFLLDGTAGYVLHRGTWHSLDRFPIEARETTFLMITDHETQDDLADADAGRARTALTEEVDLERTYGVVIVPAL